MTVYSILAAFLLDLIFGDPYDFPHPVRYIGNFISKMEKILRRLFLTERSLKFAGFLLCILTVGLSFALTFLLVRSAELVHPLLRLVAEAVIIYTAFSTKCLKDEAMKIYHILETGNLEESRKALSYIVGRDTEQLGREEIIRAVVETVAENTVDGFLSPLFFALIGGAPAAIAYKAANTLDSMVGYKNEKYLNLGFFSAKFDDVLNWIPARLSILFFAFSAALLKEDWKSSLRIGIRDRKNHKSPNCAYPEAAVAGALGICLGGTNVYFGKSVYKPTIGDKKREICPSDIIRTCRLMMGAAVFALLFGCLVRTAFGI